MHPRIARAAALIMLFVAVACARDPRNLVTSPPPGRQEEAVLVVDANLTELFDDYDIEDRSDLRRFVQRLEASVPQIPDVLLLQEIRRESVMHLMKMLQRSFDVRFDMAYGPGREVWEEDHDDTMHEVAVVTNKATMRTVKTDSLHNRYPDREATPPGLATNKLVGLAHLRRVGGIDLAVASVHFPPDRNFLDPAVAHGYRARWAESIAEGLTVLDEDAVRVVAGDFNSARCLNHTWYDCDIAPFWDAFVTEPNAIPDARQTFKDRVGWRRAPSAGVDHIFSDGFVWNYETDSDYDKSEADYYSDHRFRWALIGARR